MMPTIEETDVATAQTDDAKRSVASAKRVRPSDRDAMLWIEQNIDALDDAEYGSGIVREFVRRSSYSGLLLADDMHSVVARRVAAARSSRSREATDSARRHVVGLMPRSGSSKATLVAPQEDAAIGGPSPPDGPGGGDDAANDAAEVRAAVLRVEGQYLRQQAVLVRSPDAATNLEPQRGGVITSPLRTGESGSASDHRSGEGGAERAAAVPPPTQSRGGVDGRGRSVSPTAPSRGASVPSPPRPPSLPRPARALTSVAELPPPRDAPAFAREKRRAASLLPTATIKPEAAGASNLSVAATAVPAPLPSAASRDPLLASSDGGGLRPPPSVAAASGTASTGQPAGGVPASPPPRLTFDAEHLRQSRQRRDDSACCSVQ